jgi:hypothetical protein
MESGNVGRLEPRRESRYRTQSDAHLVSDRSRRRRFKTSNSMFREIVESQGVLACRKIKSKGLSTSYKL